MIHLSGTAGDSRSGGLVAARGTYSRLRFFRRGPEDARQEREPLAGSFTPLRMCRDESTLNGHA